VHLLIFLGVECGLFGEASSVDLSSEKRTAKMRVLAQVPVGADQVAGELRGFAAAHQHCDCVAFELLFREALFFAVRLHVRLWVVNSAFAVRENAEGTKLAQPSTLRKKSTVIPSIWRASSAS